MVAPSTPAQQRDLLAAARRGDEGAYDRLIGPHRRELHAHCYRMLGSVQDAEDALQEALLRAWRGLARFEGRSSTRSWLYKIATNTCLDQIAKRPKRVLPMDYGPPTDAHDGPGPPLTESVWIEPYPDERLGVEDGYAAPAARYEQREGVELAFIAALQHLPARQRAALILFEVLGYSAREVAEAMETTVASVNSALQRARKTVEDKRPTQSQQATLRALGDEKVAALVRRYAEAWERGDVDAVAAMLTADAAITMPPMATWFRGEQLLVFLREWAFNGRVYDAEGNRRVRVVPTRASGQPAFGTYSWDPGHGAHRPTVLQVLTLRGDRIVEITGFVDPGQFARFGLPAELPA
ncbi:putative sigma factor includes region 2 [Patulibacter medicamentivorans]|uniref:Putative sigma factor includes region 2 n=1 Tax=Patulibacter medicamentivorans TaxID=1097667 RepID=H0E1C9_9ACTN|nr:sigma-70 family RNA polymerase sigma factor [Patulibacter medicamentivorans]EHN12568.1 putative sigma factor includes region 2 [Patulibacter medicamentivorans]